MTDLRLKNKTALVTGASGAIGGSIVKKLSLLGANVILTGTNKKKIDDLKLVNYSILVIGLLFFATLFFSGFSVIEFTH